MVTTVTLNPAIDRTILADAINYGAVNRVERSREDIGGKGINVSKVLNGLGNENMAIGFIGGYNKDKVLNLLKRDGVSNDLITLNDSTRTNTIIVELEKDITTNINEPGFTVDSTDIMKMFDTVNSYAEKSDFMVFSGSIPKGMDFHIYKQLIELVRDRVLTVLDVDDKLLLEGVKGSPFMIKPNIHELRSAFKEELKSDQEVVLLAHKLIEEHGITLVLCSMGAEGSILVTKDEAYKAEPVDIDVKNTVGAGDSMVGGFIHGLLHHMNYMDCLAYGSACGALTAMTEANQKIVQSELKAMLKRINTHKIK